MSFSFERARPWFLVAIGFLIFSEVLARAFPGILPSFVQWIYSIEEGYRIPLFALLAFIETIFLAGIYFPATTIILIFIGLTQTAHDRYIYIAPLVVGVILGCAVNHWVFSREFMKDHLPRLPHRSMIARAGAFAHFPVVDIAPAIILASHPTFLGTYFAFLGMAGATLRSQLIAAGVGSTAFLTVYVTVIDYIAKAEVISSSNHHYWVTGALLLIGIIVGVWPARKT